MRIQTHLLSILLALLCLSGCSQSALHYRPIEQIQLIHTIGIDREGEQLRLTVSSGLDNGGERLLLSCTAPSIAEAMDELQHHAESKELFYAHAECLLIGEDTAREGIAPYLAYIERSSDIPLAIGLLAIRGNTAHALMEGMDDISQMLTQFESNIQRHGEAHLYSCTDTARSLSEQGSTLVCCISATETDAGDMTAIPSGFGILIDGRLNSFLSAEESMAACLLTGHTGQADLTVSDRDGGHITVTLDTSHCRIRPIWDADRLDRIDVQLSANARIVEMTHPHVLDDRVFLETLDQSLRKKLLTHIYSLLQRQANCGADFLGLGPRLRQWGVRAYTPGDFRVTVQAHVGHSSELKNSVSVSGGENLA